MRACVYYISAFHWMSYKLLCGDREGLKCVLSAFSLVCDILQNSSYTSTYFCEVLYHWCVCVCVCVCVFVCVCVCLVTLLFLSGIVSLVCMFGYTNSYFLQVLYY